MEIVKKIILVFVVLFYGCKDASNSKISKPNSKKVDSIRKHTFKKNDVKGIIKPIFKSPKKIIEDKICFANEKELSKNNNVFTYNNFSLSLSFDVESQMNYLIYKKGANIDKYILEKDDYDQPDFDMKVYALDNKYIYLLETIDYYSTTIYIYLFVDGVLTRLGDISIDQPNVEETGILKESFKICQKNDTIILESYLDNKLYGAYKLKIDKKNIVRKAQ